MRLKEITNFLESIAPLSYQEGYDNAGLICGNEDMEIAGAVICLDSTEVIVDEAIANGYNLIISHHPIVFGGLKKFNGKSYVERVIIKAIKNDIAIYTMHTNLDNMKNGVNHKICEKLGLLNCRILSPKTNLIKRLITFCPEENAEEVRRAVFASGAGTIGNYEECSFNSLGKGTFKALENAAPYVGKIGERYEGPELRLEFIYPHHLETKVVNALLQSHPYEKVAYDLIQLTNSYEEIGSGMIGSLSEEMDGMEFLEFLKRNMKTDCVRHTAIPNKKVKNIAVCGGSGSFLIPTAIANKADVFITADVKYHQFFDADNQLLIADIGHYESEQFTMELFYEILNKKFSTFALQLTKNHTNPIKYL